MSRQKQEDKGFSTVCICAVRYALGRRTYIPEIVQKFIRQNFAKITRWDLKVMEAEIKEASERPGGCGDEKIDKPGWMCFLEDIKKEIWRREGEEA